MYELIEYTDENGNIVTVRAKIQNGVRILNIDPEKEWTLGLKDLVNPENVLEIIGGRERRG